MSEHSSNLEHEVSPDTWFGDDDTMDEDSTVDLYSEWGLEPPDRGHRTPSRKGGARRKKSQRERRFLRDEDDIREQQAVRRKKRPRRRRRDAEEAFGE